MFHAWNLAPISCIFHAWHLRLPCMVQVNSMPGTGVFHAWYRRIPCMVQAYSMHGTCVFYVWYRHILCVVQAYSMRGTGMCLPCMVQVFPCMHHACIVQAYILSILIDFILAYSTCCKVQRKVYIIDSGFDCHRKMDQASWQKGQTALHTYYLYK